MYLIAARTAADADEVLARTGMYPAQSYRFANEPSRGIHVFRVDAPGAELARRRMESALRPLGDLDELSVTIEHRKL